MHGDIVSNVRENLHYLDVSIFNHILSGRLVLMVTYSDLFTFVIMLCAIITLVITFTHKK